MVAMSVITVVSIGIFLLAFWLAGVLPTAKTAIATARGAMESMRDPELGERAREIKVQTAAVKLVILSISLILRSLLALVAALAPIVAADWVGIVSRTDMFAFMGRWDVILIETVVVTLGYVVAVRL